MSYLSDASYNSFLNEHVDSLQDKTIRDHVREQFEQWYQQYKVARLVERASELLAAEQNKPHMLLLRREIDLQLMEFLVEKHSFEDGAFRGFLADDAIWGRLQPEWFTPFSVTRLSDWCDREGVSVITLSDGDALRDNGRDRGNDYQERFIDLSRFSVLEEVRHNSEQQPVVLYVDYRKVTAFQTIAASVSDRYTTVGLITDASIANDGYQHVVREPYFYLWPLVFKHLAPDIFHVNVGWSTKGVPFVAFIPDKCKAVADFYDVLSFVPDEFLEAFHSEPCQKTRATEDYLWTNCRHVVHRNGGPVNADLEERHPGKDVVPLIEYVKEPVFCQKRAASDDLHLVYGGIIIQDVSDLSSVYYKRFRDMTDSFAKDNLHLYIYPSPYLYGFGKPWAVEHLIKSQGLSNVHACEALEADRWVRDISKYDYGILPFPDRRPMQCTYTIPFKFISYLRAGLPVIVPEDYTIMVDFVRDNNIGVVCRYDERHNMPEILAGQDIDVLKENVVRFRSSLSIERGRQKIVEMYERILSETMASRKTLVQVETPLVDSSTTLSPTQAPPKPVLAIDGRDYISEREYARYLEASIEQADPDMDKAYVRARYEAYAQQYRVERMRQRGEELLEAFQNEAFALYLDGDESLYAAAQMLTGPAGKRFARFKGFVVEDAYLAAQDIKTFAPYSVVPRSRAHEMGTVVFCLSGHVPAEGGAEYQASDVREKFIDLRRFDSLRETRRSWRGHNVILYPMYREIHTVAAMAGQVKKADPRFRSISLSPGALIHEEFDAMLVEPFGYLWPLVLQVVDPDLIHLNVGWGIQALALSPFIPDRGRTVVDFYEVLAFLPDAYFEKTHSTAQQVRSAERHFITHYDRIMHLCSETITDRLKQKYHPNGTVISVTEYLQEPVYNVPPRDDGVIRLVYGGCMLGRTDPNDQHYKAFVKIAPCFSRENLHLYIYHSPYVHGLNAKDELDKVIKQHGFTNIHACRALPLGAFAEAISKYDYGAMFIRPKDMDGAEYNYFMATKMLVYLQAGLPIVMDADNRYMASLVERYNIGVVLTDDDYQNLPAILNQVDLHSLKANVMQWRNEFSIEKGVAKVLKMYHDLLERAGRKTKVSVSVPAPAISARREVGDGSSFDFQDLTASVARADRSLYHRAQSSQTLSSLASLAQQHDPSVVVELGTRAGLSLRAWLAGTERAKIVAIDRSFDRLRQTTDSHPVDLSRVTLREQDVLEKDFATLWTTQDKVLLFVEDHDIPGRPIMNLVLTSAIPALPDGSVVVIDNLWYSDERLTVENAKAFLENRVRGDIDELQCFEGHYAPYHGGGSFMGFAEVKPLLEFVNRYGIELEFDPRGKHVSFVWKRAYALRWVASTRSQADDAEHGCGSVTYNPMESVPVGPRASGIMRSLAEQYRQHKVEEVAEQLSELISRYPHDRGVAYGLAVCLARLGRLSEARDVLARRKEDLSHPRCRELLDDLIKRVGPSEAIAAAECAPASTKPTVTLFAMPKGFTGHNGIIQKNAIRSWARLTPKPEIILFGDEPGVKEMAREVGGRHIPEIGRNEFGTPLVNELFATAQHQASNSVIAYVNADIILLQDFIDGVEKTQTKLAEFLLIGQRWDVSVLEQIDFTDARWPEMLLRETQTNGFLHAECGLDYFVFRRDMYREIPPFAIGRTAWDNWLVMAPSKAGVPVVDGTDFITAIHQEHDYGHVAGGRKEAWDGIEASRNRALLGVSDNSGLTSGATWRLCRDGTPVAVQPRVPHYLTIEYKERRDQWLVRQADRLMAEGHPPLAAAKWEESLSYLESYLALERRQKGDAQKAEQGALTHRFLVGCTKLACCYMRMDRVEQVVAVYERLLNCPDIQLPQDQRRAIVQLRDEANTVAQRLTASTESVVSVPAPQAHLPRPDEQAPYHTALCELERQYRAMPEGTRAKGTLAARLSSLFRRAGLMDRHRALEAERSVKGDISAPANAPVVETFTAAQDRPKVSIVTACYNCVRFLPECFESVKAQSFLEWEWFLLDDGSSDGTRQLIETYSERDPRIKPFYFDRNMGPYARRNFAIQRAASDFILIHDADDIMVPAKLDRLYHTITSDDRLAMVGSHYKLFVDGSVPELYGEERKLPQDHDAILEEVMHWGHGVSHGTAIIRKSMFGRIGLYDENPWGSDTFWTVKLAEYTKRYPDAAFRNLPECLTYVRVHDASQTQRMPLSDPRNRRSRYRDYCRIKLKRMHDKLASVPGADLAAELRQCDCSDFLTRFKAHIIKWESEALDPRVLSELFQLSSLYFDAGQFVACISTLAGIQAIDPMMAERVMGYDLMCGLAFFAVGLKERSQEHLDREIRNHNSPVARQFVVDAFECSKSLDVRAWLKENFGQYGSIANLSRDSISQVQGILDPAERECGVL